MGFFFRYFITPLHAFNLRTVTILLISIAQPNAHAIEPTQPHPTKTIFSTSPGLGFDKQISIWLIEKYISPDKPVVFFNDDTPPPNTQVFDETGADFFRSAERSTYEQLVDAYHIENQTTDYLKRIVFDIEINLWLHDELPDSAAVEKAFRSLQERWGRDQVPHACYKEFFHSLDALYIKNKSLSDSEKIVGELTCWSEALKNQINDPAILVAEMPIPVLLGHIRSGAKVAFVDVREPDEFAENHIPGAVNISIRDAELEAMKNLKAYDIVVAYCIKDFRGFEMAKKLKSLGVSQAVILKPYGIKGWIDSQLPIYQQNSFSEQEAENLLDACIKQPLNCKKQLTSEN